MVKPIKRGDTVASSRSRGGNKKEDNTKEPPPRTAQVREEIITNKLKEIFEKLEGINDSSTIARPKKLN